MIKTLIYDIETSPCLGWFWGTGKQRINANQIRRPGKIICISYRFQHWPEGKVKNLKWDRKMSDEKMVRKFAQIADDADIIVGHNGDRFDKRWINTRLAYFGHPTIRHLVSEDTLKQARTEFYLPSYRLDFMCKFFKIPGKLSTSSSLWEEVVFNNNRHALQEMVDYCDNDVLILSMLYDRIYPYVKHKISKSVFYDRANSCPSCGSVHLQKRGFLYTAAAKKQRYQCIDCGVWSHTGKNLIKNSGDYMRS